MCSQSTHLSPRAPTFRDKLNCPVLSCPYHGHATFSTNTHLCEHVRNNHGEGPEGYDTAWLPALGWVQCPDCGLPWIRLAAHHCLAAAATSAIGDWQPATGDWDFLDTIHPSELFSSRIATPRDGPRNKSVAAPLI